MPRRPSGRCSPDRPRRVWIASLRVPSYWFFPVLPMATPHRIFTTSFASVYPHYVAKAEKKGRLPSEVDAILRWLTGYTQEELEGQLKAEKDFETFFREAPRLN